MKIALLEDNPGNSEFMQTLLEMEGHEVFPHPKGHSLLTALEFTGDDFPYDAIIIDILLLNTLSGLDIMHRLQQKYPSRLLPLIVVSALTRQELDRVQADFPETPIIRKPFKFQELLEAVQQVANRSTVNTTSHDGR
jgi:DNA-binding response OmpR family regulator